MSAALISQATLLYRLQTLDPNIEQHRTRLAPIKAALANDERVAVATRAVEAVTQALNPWQTRARNLDLEIKSVAEKNKATEQRLYSGRVSNPKELGDMQGEIESLKKR